MSLLKKYSIEKIILALCCFGLSVAVQGEQYFSGEIKRIDIVNYNQGAAYLHFESAGFNECPKPTSWCAIDFSLPSGNQMYSAALAAKMAGKKIGVTTNSCWSGGQYARCWKIHVAE